MANKNNLFEVSKNLLMQDINTIYFLIKKSTPKNKSIFMLGTIPYFTACIDGAIDFMTGNNIDCSNLSIINDYTPVLRKTRGKIKMYREHTGKNLSVIDTIREDQEEKFANLMRFPSLKRFGIHYDFGTYILGGQYIGNTFLYRWFYDEVEKIEIEKPEFEYARALGEAIGFIKNTWHTNYQVEGNFAFDAIRYKDYNITHRASKLFIPSVNKEQALMLFNIMCQINFALYYIDKVLSKQNS